MATAGDLIRAAVADGATQLGLAKRLADRDPDADAESHREVERWRFVIRRAVEGSEPDQAQARRISEFFGEEVEQQAAASRSSHRAALEDALKTLMDGQQDTLKRLAALQETLDARLPAQQARRQTPKR